MTELCSNKTSQASEVLFSATSAIPHVYLLGSKIVDFHATGTIDINSSYDQNTAISLTTNCKDIWAPTSITGAPVARAYHTAVWTGSKMIIWGGNSSSAKLNTGGAYMS